MSLVLHDPASGESVGAVHIDVPPDDAREAVVAAILEFQRTVSEDGYEGQLGRLAKACRASWNATRGKLPWLRGRELQRQGDYAAALVAFERATSYGDENSVQLGIGASLVGLGRRGEASTLLPPLIARWKKELNGQGHVVGHVRPREAIARAHAILGQKPQALDWLDRARQKGDALFADHDPDFAQLHVDPDFREVMTRVIGPPIGKLLKLARAETYRDVPDCTFAMAMEIDTKICIQAEHSEAALSALRGLYGAMNAAQLQALGIGFPANEMVQLATLDAVFEAWGTALHRDSKGNVTNLYQGGEDWAFALLAPIVTFIEPGSVVYALDDEGFFWRVRFEGASVRYSVGVKPNKKAAAVADG